MLSALLLAPGLEACQPPRPEQTLVVASRNRIDALDPIAVYSIGAQQVLSALGDPLYALDAQGRLLPRLATAPPQISADGRHARINLRRGVLFHDGSRFDGPAMAFSLQRFMAAAKLAYLLTDRVKAVRAVGPYSIELELHRPFSPLPRLLSSVLLTPVSPQAYRQHPRRPMPGQFVGTGPYRLIASSTEQQRLRPFRHYWGPAPRNAGLDLVTLSNSTALLGALRSGEVDVLLSTSLEVDHRQALHRDAERGVLREGRGPAFEISYLTLLTDQPPLQNPTLRRAIAHSLDRQLISRRVTLGLQPPLRQLVPPSLPGSDPAAWPTYDPQQARRLLRQAGYCQGRVLSLPLTFRSNVPSDRLFALTWQAQLQRDLADCLRLEVNGLESTTAYRQLGDGTFPLILLDWMGDYPDADNYLAPLLSCRRRRGQRCLEGNSASSGSFWSTVGLERDLERSTSLTGPSRDALLRRIQRQTAAASPYIPVWLVAPLAWSRPDVSTPRFDGSGRVDLAALHKRTSTTHHPRTEQLRPTAGPAHGSGSSASGGR